MTETSNTENNLQTTQAEYLQKTIAFYGGKGGIGKTSAATILAMTLSARGYNVCLFDGDFTGQSVPGALYSAFTIQQSKHRIKPTNDHQAINQLISEYKLNKDNGNFTVIDNEGTIEYKNDRISNINFLDRIVNRFMKIKNVYVSAPEKRYDGNDSYQNIVKLIRDEELTFDEILNKYNNEESILSNEIRRIELLSDSDDKLEAKLKEEQKRNIMETKVVMALKESYNGSEIRVRDKKIKELIIENYMTEFKKEYNSTKNENSLISNVIGNLHAVMAQNISNPNIGNMVGRHPELFNFIMDEVKESSMDYVIIDVGAGFRENDLRIADDADAGILVINDDDESPRQGGNVIWQSITSQIRNKYGKSSDSSNRAIAKAWEEAEKIQHFWTYFDNYEYKPDQQKLMSLLQEQRQLAKDGKDTLSIEQKITDLERGENINLPYIQNEIEKIKKRFGTTYLIANRIGLEDSEIKKGVRNVKQTAALHFIETQLPIYVFVDGNEEPFKYEGSEIFTRSNCRTRSDIEIMAKLAAKEIHPSKKRMIKSLPELKKNSEGVKYPTVKVDKTNNKLELIRSDKLPAMNDVIKTYNILADSIIKNV